VDSPGWTEVATHVLNQDAAPEVAPTTRLACGTEKRHEH
jgi:hypothetical protein